MNKLLSYYYVDAAKNDIEAAELRLLSVVSLMGNGDDETDAMNVAIERLTADLRNLLRKRTRIAKQAQRQAPTAVAPPGGPIRSNDHGR